MRNPINIKPEEVTPMSGNDDYLRIVADWHSVRHEVRDFSWILRKLDSYFGDADAKAKMLADEIRNHPNHTGR